MARFIHFQRVRGTNPAQNGQLSGPSGLFASRNAKITRSYDGPSRADARRSRLGARRARGGGRPGLPGSATSKETTWRHGRFAELSRSEYARRRPARGRCRCANPAQAESFPSRADFEPDRPAPMARPRRLRRDATVCRATRTGSGAQATHPLGNEPAVSRSGRRSRNSARLVAGGVPSRTAGRRQVRSAVVERNRRVPRALGVRMECQGNVVEVRERTCERARS